MVHFIWDKYSGASDQNNRPINEPKQGKSKTNDNEYLTDYSNESHDIRAKKMMMNPKKQQPKKANNHQQQLFLTISVNWKLYNSNNDNTITIIKYNNHNWNDNKLVACLPHDDDDNEYVEEYTCICYPNTYTYTYTFTYSITYTLKYSVSCSSLASCMHHLNLQQSVCQSSQTKHYRVDFEKKLRL